MNPRMIVSTALAAMSLVFAVSCSSAKKDKKEDKKTVAEESKPVPVQGEVSDTNSEVTEAIADAARVNDPVNVQTAPMTDQVDFASIEFDKGESKLSEMDRRHLNELQMKMTGGGKVIDDIKILTWSDRAVTKDMDATNTEIILARQRAESVKRYLERILPDEEDMDFYNMAENPERYSNYMQRKGVPVNEAFNADGEKVATDGHALVIIEYQSGPTPSQL